RKGALGAAQPADLKLLGGKRFAPLFKWFFKLVHELLLRKSRPGAFPRSRAGRIMRGFQLPVWQPPPALPRRILAALLFGTTRIMQVSKSNKLANVCYDIRGPVLKHAKRLEDEGQRILKLNIGNPAPFGFEAPEEILQDVIRNLPTAQGYSDSKGLFSARKAVMQYYQQKQVEGVGIEDIYLGNGVSELIMMSMQA